MQLGVIAIVFFPLRPREGSTATPRRADDEVIGGSVWAGFSHVVKSPYLLGICLFQILYVIGSTVLYFAQTDIVGHAYADRTARTAVLARIEFYVQLLAVLTQVFLTGRVIRWLGLAGALAVLPAISIVGFGAMGAMPVFAAMAVFTVARRGMNFAVTNPAMEVLFTVVSREDKYKAKNVIETFVYRGGDQIAAWMYAGLAAIGLGLAGISFVAIPVSAVWLGLGIWLGHKQTLMAGSHGAVETPPASDLSLEPV